MSHEHFVETCGMCDTLIKQCRCAGMNKLEKGGVCEICKTRPAYKVLPAEPEHDAPKRVLWNALAVHRMTVGYLAEIAAKEFPELQLDQLLYDGGLLHSADW